MDPLRRLRPAGDAAVTLAFRVDRKVAEAAEQAAVVRGLSVEEWLAEVVQAAIPQRRRPPRNVRIARMLGTAADLDRLEAPGGWRASGARPRPTRR